MEGVEAMSEKRWVISKEMLNMLRLIRSNCQMCSDCSWCPLASDEDYRLCMVQSLPETWSLEELEERDG